MADGADKEVGIVKSAGFAEDDEGKEVLRVIVDFYEGNAPSLTAATIWKREPVRIILAQNAG